jgi:HupE / UreJ protein
MKKTLCRGLVRVCLLIGWGIWPLIALAHQPSDAYMHLEVKGQDLQVRWHIALRDLNHVFMLDADGDHKVSWGEFLDRSGEVDDMLRKSLRVQNDKATCAPQPAQFQVEQLSSGTFIVADFVVRCAHTIASLDLRYDFLFEFDPSHRGLANLAEGEVRHPIVFTDEQRDKALRVGARDTHGYVFQYLRLGVEHILSGMDHVLFVVGLILASLNAGRLGFKQLLLAVSAFTVAHCTTLVLSAAGYFSPPGRIVEPLIALSIVFVAVNNITRSITRWELVLVFLFGLFHGLGFSSTLDIVRLPLGEKLLTLASFNVGIEIGQLLVIGATVPLLFLALTKVRSSTIVVCCSAGMAGFSSIWFVERAFNFSIITN